MIETPSPHSLRGTLPCLATEKIVPSAGKQLDTSSKLKPGVFILVLSVLFCSSGGRFPTCPLFRRPVPVREQHCLLLRLYFLQCIREREEMRVTLVDDPLTSPLISLLPPAAKWTRSLLWTTRTVLESSTSLPAPNKSQFFQLWSHTHRRTSCLSVCTTACLISSRSNLHALI